MALVDWGPGAIEIGTQEAEEATTALVSAAVKLDGASAGPANERGSETLWYQPESDHPTAKEFIW